MAAYAWARSRSLLSRLSHLSEETPIDEKVQHERPKGGFEGETLSNERYFAALRNGGIWLS